MRKFLIIIFLFALLFFSSLVFAQEVIEDVEATQKINQNNNFFIDPVSLILIVLSALTVIFTLFLCFLALMVFSGWQSARDFKAKQKELLIRQKKIVEEGEREIKRNREQGKKLIKELKKQKGKIKTPADFKRYKDKTEELIDELEKSIKMAEGRISNLKISGISSSSSVIGSTVSGSPNLYIGTASDSPSSYIGAYPYEKKCRSCGKTYLYNGNGVFSECPYCGYSNY